MLWIVSKDKSFLDAIKMTYHNHCRRDWFLGYSQMSCCLFLIALTVDTMSKFQSPKFGVFGIAVGGNADL